MTGKKSPPFALPRRYVYTGQFLVGGQGDVFICNDTSLGRQVAVKTLRDVGNADALSKEIEARAKIKSKHVAEVYDSLVDAKGKPVAIVMEFVPGESLDHGSVRPVTNDGLLRLLYQIACGIEDIHAAGVIHRDIKPFNMKVDSSGVLKIFDLGIANIDATSASTVGGAGTFAFRAPELYGAASPKRVTAAVDVYALGVTAWWLLVQSLPPALVEIPPLKSGQPPKIATAFNGLKELAPLIDRSLHNDPSRRPSATEIRRQVAFHLTHDKRRGVFSSGGALHELNEVGTTTRVEIRDLGMVRVTYTSSGRFVIREVTGDVFVNNMRASVDEELPDSCVLTFGPPEAGSRRVFVPFDVSEPAIVL